MLSRIFGRSAPQPTCPHCEADLIKQAKQQLVDGCHVAAIASARCYVAKRLREVCVELGLFKKSRQKKHPNLASMAWRVCDVGVIDQKTYDKFTNFGKYTATTLDGGSVGGGARAWKTISHANALVQKLNAALCNFQQTAILAANAKRDPAEPDQDAML